MNDFSTWPGIIALHLQRYPVMTARDVYKLLYQGILGPEHSMPSAEIFSARLEQELADLQPDASQPLLEDIRPDGALQRIHLRPWLARGQDLSVLVQACLGTGAREWGEAASLRSIWGEFLEQVAQGAYPSIQIEEAREFDALLRRHDYPAAHHSAVYMASYKPAYRLVASEVLA